MRNLKRMIAFSFLFGSILLTDCNALVSNEQLCGKDLKNYDHCLSILLLTDPACGQGIGTCTIGHVELAKSICGDRMKLQGCRAHRD
ncbi:hypothetical protein EHO60_05220 [Leptospira fletcheri]|uniref:Uncharacterized protein n=2 Tax=Leptospira fletcheri TaxID=2484981 RepID=A0A4R9GK49_9LEPT|nr:hypothetical protein EHO60_05220 [Leptospira fletcheri]